MKNAKARARVCVWGGGGGGGIKVLTMHIGGRCMYFMGSFKVCCILLRFITY